MASWQTRPRVGAGPSGSAITRDGSLLMSEDGNGTIWRSVGPALRAGSVAESLDVDLSTHGFASSTQGRAAYGSSIGTGLTERAFQAVAALAPRPDIVVITGDLTECGAAGIRSVCPSRALSRDADLRHPGQPRPACSAPPRARAFSWRPERSGLRAVHRRDYPVRLVMLDTLVPGEPPRRTVPGTAAPFSTGRSPAQPGSPDHRSPCTIRRSPAASITWTTSSANARQPVRAGRRESPAGAAHYLRPPPSAGGRAGRPGNCSDRALRSPIRWSWNCGPMHPARS